MKSSYVITILENLNGRCSVFLVCDLYIVYLSGEFDGGESRSSSAACGDETSEAHAVRLLTKWHKKVV